MKLEIYYSKPLITFYLQDEEILHESTEKQWVGEISTFQIILALIIKGKVTIMSWCSLKWYAPTRRTHEILSSIKSVLCPKKFWHKSSKPTENHLKTKQKYSHEQLSITWKYNKNPVLHTYESRKPSENLRNVFSSKAL